MPGSPDHNYIRAQIATEGGKALLIINGGGIVTLLGFLSTIWGNEKSMIIPSILDGIWYLSLALTCASSNFFFRYWTSTHEEKGKAGYKKLFWSLEWSSIIASFILFLTALNIVVTGAGEAFDKINKPSTPTSIPDTRKTDTVLFH